MWTIAINLKYTNQICERKKHIYKITSIKNKNTIKQDVSFFKALKLYTYLLNY